MRWNAILKSFAEASDASTYSLPRTSRRIPRPSLKSSSVSAVIPLLICALPVFRTIREKSMTELPAYKAFALRYATTGTRTRRDNFIFTDVHGVPMPIDYFIWAIQNADRTIVIDAGFNKTDGERR